MGGLTSTLKISLAFECSSTTLADLFTPLCAANPFSAVRASLRWWPSDQFDDGLAHGGQCRLSVSRHADKLFVRIRSVIKDRFADSDFGPLEVAVETGLSLRYVQKLFNGPQLHL
jgi:hypothetical protein